MDYSQEIIFTDPPSKYIQTAKKKVEVLLNKKNRKENC